MNEVKKISIIVLLLITFALPIEVNAAKDPKAVLTLSPSSGTFYIGSTFDVSIFVNTGGYDVNAFQIDMEFPEDKLQVAKPFIGKSIIKVWSVPPSYSNLKGTISLQGGVPHPGIKTSSGLILTITFRAKAPGLATISFSDSCKVLLDDGVGTDVLKTSTGATYNLSIPPPEGPLISSPTHPDQTKWYKNNQPTLIWQKESGVTDFSYILTKDPTTVPNSTSEGSKNTVSYDETLDGVWYFHLKAKKAGTWGGVSTFVLRIDTAPPADFKPECESSCVGSRPPVISFFTTDSASGVDHYEIKIINIGKTGEESETYFFTEQVSPYQLPELERGTFEIIVRAFDRAGNWKDGIIETKIISPWLGVIKAKGIEIKGLLIPWPYLFLILLIIAGLIGFLIFRRKKREKKTHKKIRENIDGLKKGFSQKLQELDGKIHKDMAARKKIKEELDTLGDIKKQKATDIKT